MKIEEINEKFEKEYLIIFNVNPNIEPFKKMLELFYKKGILDEKEYVVKEFTPLINKFEGLTK